MFQLRAVIVIFVLFGVIGAVLSNLVSVYNLLQLLKTAPITQHDWLRGSAASANESAPRDVTRLAPTKGRGGQEKPTREGQKSRPLPVDIREMTSIMQAGGKEESKDRTTRGDACRCLRSLTSRGIWRHQRMQ